MKSCPAAAAMLLLVAPTFAARGDMPAAFDGLLALDGEPGMHDPSTVIQAGGRFYDQA